MSRKRNTLANEVANGIVTDIVNGKLKPGDQIPCESDLAERFSVGRGTVREAVKLLVSRSVLEIRRAKGTFVCESPGVSQDPFGLEFMQQDKVKMINDLLEIRTVLERYSAGAAAKCCTPQQIACMKEIIYNAENAADDAECIQYDIAFHRFLAESSGNSVIAIVLPIIQKALEDFNALDFERDWSVVHKGHRAIVAAIEKHDPDLAAEKVTAHLEYAKIRLDNMNLKKD